MTSAVATIGVVFDGTDVQEIDGIFLELVSGLTGEGLSVRGVDVTIPGLAGRVARLRRADVRRIELRGFVRGVGATRADAIADFRANMDDLDALFDKTADPAVLSVTTEDGIVRTINARTVDLMLGEEVVSGEFQYVSVVLESVDPDWSVGS